MTRTNSLLTIPGMLMLLVMSALGFAGYALLLPIAPLWAVHGGADETGAGLVNAVLMGATVLAQLGVHPAIRRWGWAPVLCAGVLTLGLPALLFPVTDDLSAILALSAVRGVGFAVITVGGSSAVAELVPHSRRGRAVGLYGLAIAFPQLLLVPLGPTLTTVLPIAWVFVLGALPVVALPFALRLGRVITAGHAAEVDSALDSGAPGTVSGVTAPARLSRSRALVLLLLPVVSLLAVTAPGGALLSFAPQFAPSTQIAALGLLAFTGATTIARWLLGHAADRFGPVVLIAPLLAIGAVGLLLCALGTGSQSASLLIGGMLLVGVAYGGVQNVTLVAAFALVPRNRELASTAWNIGFDIGTGIGSLAVGAIAAGASFQVGLGWAAAVCLVAVVVPCVHLLRRR